MFGIVSFSEGGDGHRNEDAFVVAHHPLDSSVVVCIVADSQGGRAGGAQAAQLACHTAIQAVVNIPPDLLKEPRTWSGLLREVDEAVRADGDAGFTTAVGLCVADGRTVGASCGDSAALLVSGNQCVELTRGQRKNPPIGSGSALPVPFEADLEEPWRLLVLTDGVWKYVGWQRLIETARRQGGAELIAELQQAARLPGSGRFQDDFTVVILE